MTISIVLADDHHIVREGLKTILGALPDFQIVGEADDGLQVGAVVERLKPDVLVLDLMMPGLNGLEISRQVRRNTPQTQIVVLSMHANEAYVAEALAAGAAAYLLKRSTSDELANAIREAVAGRRYLSPPLSDRLIDAYIRKLEAEEEDDPYTTLTPREREVLHLAAEGATNNQIAERLSLSVRTVEKHRSNLMHKLALKTQTDLIRYALQKGILFAEN
ncbi:MAG: response regulator transcription factor [Anaerolineae bacterium]|nr:response regulator transcription factor [Anaerolineae bacterium]